MNKNEKHWVYAIGIIVVVALGANYMGYTAQFGWPKMFSQTGGNGGNNGNNNGQTIPTDDYKSGVGKYVLDCKAFDSADMGTVYTIGTNVNVFWLHFVGGVWTPDSGAYAPGSTNYYTAQPSDNGFAWVEVSVPAGQAYFVDYGKIQSGSSYITSRMFVDTAGAGTKNFVFQYDLRNHEIPNSGYPVLSFNVYLIQNDTAFALTMPSNVTSVGTTQTYKYGEPYLTQAAEKEGDAIYQVRLKVNCTTPTEITLKDFTIPGIGQLDGSAFTPTITDSYTIWTYTISTSFNGADYLLRMPNSMNKNYMDFQLQLTLPAGEHLVLWIYIDYLDPVSGTGKTLTGVMMYSA